MRIKTNISAMNAYRMNVTNNTATEKSLQKLSSGLRINKAGDDAAGLAISEKMRGQIRGLGQASRNIQDGISMIQTAEGAGATIHSMLQRIRELAVAAASDTMTDSDRSQVQSEISELASQIDTTANNTEFNTIKLLNCSGGPLQDTVDLLNAGIPGWINDSIVAISSALDIAHPDSPVKRTMNVAYVNDASATYAASMGTADGGATLTLTVNLAKVGSVSQDQMDRLIAHEMVHAFEFTEMKNASITPGPGNDVWFMEGLAMLIQGGVGFPSPDNYELDRTTPFDGDYGAAFRAVQALHEITIGGIAGFINRLEAGLTLDNAFLASNQNIMGTQLNSALLLSGDFTTAAGFVNWYNANPGIIQVWGDDFLGTGAIRDGATQGSSTNLTAADTILNGTGLAEVNEHYTLNFINADAFSSADSMNFQIGANSDQSIGFIGGDLRTSTLGIDSLAVTTKTQANSAIGQIDSAITTVSSTRGYFGAMQNRLEHALSVTVTSGENLVASESRIRDLDMAKEMTAFTKSNILAQVSVSILAQANQQPQAVLQLLQAS